MRNVITPHKIPHTTKCDSAQIGTPTKIPNIRAIPLLTVLESMITPFTSMDQTHALYDQKHVAAMVTVDILQ